MLMIEINVVIATECNVFDSLNVSTNEQVSLIEVATTLP